MTAILLPRLKQQCCFKSSGSDDSNAVFMGYDDRKNDVLIKLNDINEQDKN